MTLEEIQVSPKVILRPGDHIRLKGGPFCKREDGSLRKCGYRGEAVIDGIEEGDDGVVLHCTSISRSLGCRWEYVPARITGETTTGLSGMIKKPYSVVKCRSRLDVQPFPIHIPPRRRR